MTLLEETKEAPFWSDDFDMDLLKIIPDTRNILKEFDGVKLFTTGHTTYGRLNHPDVWNGTKAMLAFFGLRSAPRSTFYVTNNPEVECTVLEAFRDAWAHQFRMNVEGIPVWDTTWIWPDFQDIMQHIRGWRIDEAKADLAIRRSRASIDKAADRLRKVIADHASAPVGQTLREGA